MQEIVLGVQLTGMLLEVLGLLRQTLEAEKNYLLNKISTKAADAFGSGESIPNGRA